MRNIKLVFALLGTVHLISNLCSSSAQELTAVICGARLPTGFSYATSMYDGNDTIYVFGGNRPDYPNALKYSISQDTIVAAAGELPVPSSGGGMISDKSGNIFYIGGKSLLDNKDGQIFQYFPETENFVNVSTLQKVVYDLSVIKTDEDTALIFGEVDGDYSNFKVQKLNLNTLESEIIAEIPTNPWLFSDHNFPAVWVEEHAVVYIFDGFSDTPKVVKFDPSTSLFEFLPNPFPRMGSPAQVVYDGMHAYLVGSFGSTQDIVDVPADSILQFDPDTGDIQFIKVRHFPGWMESEFFGTTAAYIDKLDTIYMFGGYSQAAGLRDEIFSISLEPLRSLSGKNSN